MSSSLYSNLVMLRIERGAEPAVGEHPQRIAAASAGIREALKSNADQANAFGRWQFRFLILGALFYVAWHVLEMYHRVGVAQHL